MMPCLEAYQEKNWDWGLGSDIKAAVITEWNSLKQQDIIKKKKRWQFIKVDWRMTERWWIKCGKGLEGWNIQTIENKAVKEFNDWVRIINKVKVRQMTDDKT